jgi:uncharacterized protein YjcR
VDWKKIKAEYIAGGTSYRKLAEKYGVSPTTLTKVAGREGWVEARHQADIKKTLKIVDSVSTKEANKAVDIVCVADKLLAKITDVLDGVTSTQDIRQLTSALKDLRDIKGVKSEADTREQEARIAKLQKEVQSDDSFVDANNEQMQALATLLKAPEQNRTLDDFEDGDTDG